MLPIATAVLRGEPRLELSGAAIIAIARLAGAFAIAGNDRAGKAKPLGIRYIHLDDVLRETDAEEDMHQ